MFAAANDQHVVQHPAVIQVIDQSVPRFVETRAKLDFHPLVMIPMRIPTAAGQSILIPKTR